jgi:hypothetical protein
MSYFFNFRKYFRSMSASRAACEMLPLWRSELEGTALRTGSFRVLAPGLYGERDVPTAPLVLVRRR